MKAVVVGAGRIGCGFAGHVLRRSGYELVFVARDAELVAHLNRLRRYDLQLSDGHRAVVETIDEVRAVGTFEPDAVARELADCDLVVTAVGAGNLPEIAPLIASGLSLRREPVNVMAFENLSHASRRLRQLIVAALPAEARGLKHGYAGVLVDRVVARRLGNPAGDEPLVFVGELRGEFHADALGLLPPLPHLEGMCATDQHEAWVNRKLYTYSAGHAAAAYLGYLKGYHYIHTAIRDREIRLAVLAAMSEGQHGLLAHYGRVVAGKRSDLLAILDRFANPLLGDRIERVGRDPQRKLGMNERLVGAAQLAMRAGVPPRHLALVAAAALCFVDEDDASTAELRRVIDHEGPERTIQRVCGLRPHRGLGRLVRADCTRLLNGHNGGGLLLRLGDELWSSGPEETADGSRHVGNGGNGKHTHAGNHGEPPRADAEAAAAPNGLNVAGRAPRLYFMLVRRVPPVPSPVLVEVFRHLEQRGFQVESGIAEELVQRPDHLAAEHDLYVLKSHTELALSLAGVLHHEGARILNPYPNAMAIQNKIVCARLLRAAGIPSPDCWVTGDLTLVREAAERGPLIVKPYLGHRGQGLRLVRHPSELDQLPRPEHPVIVQEYIEGSPEDLKVYVVGDDVFAVRKPFSPTSFTRSGAPVAVDPEVRAIALRCGRALGLGLYGLDVLEVDGALWVVDVNTFPGYKGVPDVAPLIARYIEDYALGRISLPVLGVERASDRGGPSARPGLGHINGSVA
jgi:mannitol-1-phosphate/altronate dehydrogenase/glutathione synthase/RimK-type ligase-like ATP-grasp enzyme